MSIRSKTLIIIVSSMLLFLGGMSALSGMLVLDSYRELENDILENNIARAENAFSREAENMLRVTRDWSFWDDTYAYVDDMNDAYERVNLQAETLETLHISAMVFLSPDGTLVSSAPGLPEKNPFVEWARFNGRLLAHRTGPDGFSGFFLLEENLFMVSGAPILRSNGTGPSKGSLIFARKIGTEETASISRSLLLPLTIHIAGKSLPEELRLSLAAMETSGKPFASRPLSPGAISGLSVLRDIEGDPAGLIEIVSRRHVFLQGKRTVIVFFFWLALFGGFQAVLILFLLKKSVTDRLQKTGRILENIASRGSLGERMPLSGRDEITSLSGSINSMLSSLERLVENIPDPLFLSDGRQIVHANRMACFLLSAETPALEGKDISSFLVEEVPLSEQPEQKSPVFEGRLLPPGGSGIPVEIHRRSFLLGERTLTLSVARDITIRKDLENSLRKMAYYDEKTELPNRSRFLQLIEEAIRTGEVFAVALLDMDRFRLINDMVGPAKGDEVLLEMRDRIMPLLSPGDVLARTGGDSFGAILRGRDSREEASEVLAALKKEIMAPLFVDGKTLFPSVSAGVLNGAQRCVSSAAVLARAEAALLQAKKRGLGQTALFRDDGETEAQDILTAEAQLRNALEMGELVLYYQPIVRLEGRGVEGFEALIRWQHPERGLILPGDFIPLAEETGLIPEIDRWAALQACRDIARFRDGEGNGREMKVSVNASSRSILEGDYCSDLSSGAAAAGISPGLLTVEITEGVLISSPAAAAASLAALRREGISVALDDFGTGYSSLQYLSRLPIDRLKIDGSFIRQLFSGDGDMRLVKGILALAGDLGMETVTECIEREDQYLWALEQGATFGQGFFFGHPRPFGEASALLLRT